MSFCKTKDSLKKAGLLLGLSMVAAAPASAQARLCAADSFGETILLQTDSNFDAGALVGLRGWIFNGATLVLPFTGSGVVNAAGTSVRVSIEAVNHINNQRVGIGMDTDFLLNGTGKFENVDSDVYRIHPVSWTALDSCPDLPPFHPSPDGDTTVPPSSAVKGLR